MANLGFSQSRGAARGYGQENVFRVSLLLQLRMNSCSFFRHWDFFCTARVHKETVFASCFCNLAISVCFYRSCPRKQVAILAQHHFLDEEPKIEVYMKIVEKICNLCMIGLSTDFLRGKKSLVGYFSIAACKKTTSSSLRFHSEADVALIANAPMQGFHTQTKEGSTKAIVKEG